MSMLVKERWIYDPTRGLKRDTKNPQQSDDDLRSFLGGKHSVVVEIEEDVVVPPAKKQQRRAGVKHKRQAAAVPPDEIDFDDILDPVPEKKQKKGEKKEEFSSADVFDTNTESNKRGAAGKQKLTQPPIPPVPKAPPQVTSDDINAMLDSKLEKMFSIIAKNQANLEQSFVKALEEQRKEFVLAQKAVSAPSRHTGLNISPAGGLNFSPSTALAGTGLFISNIYIEFIVLL